jgi:hypothetical protein
LPSYDLSAIMLISSLIHSTPSLLSGINLYTTALGSIVDYLPSITLTTGLAAAKVSASITM